MAGIPDEVMGDVWPKAQPGPDGADYGRTRFAPQGRFPVRSFQTFTLVYTVGEFGLDDTGAIKIVTRWTGDGGGVHSAIRRGRITRPLQPQTGSSCSYTRSPTPINAPGITACGSP